MDGDPTFEADPFQPGTDGPPTPFIGPPSPFIGPPTPVSDSPGYSLDDVSYGTAGPGISGADYLSQGSVSADDVSSGTVGPGISGADYVKQLAQSGGSSDSGVPPGLNDFFKAAGGAVNQVVSAFRPAPAATPTQQQPRPVVYVQGQDQAPPQAPAQPPVAPASPAQPTRSQASPPIPPAATPKVPGASPVAPPASQPQKPAAGTALTKPQPTAPANQTGPTSPAPQKAGVGTYVAIGVGGVGLLTGIALIAATVGGKRRRKGPLD